MGISLSILLLAVGAVLTWAVSADVSGLDINAVGVILMIVGALGLVVSLVFWSSWGGFGGREAGAGGGGTQTNIIKDD
jgi:Domain of unknown function (DUF6458)